MLRRERESNPQGSSLAGVQSRCSRPSACPSIGVLLSFGGRDGDRTRKGLLSLARFPTEYRRQPSASPSMWKLEMRRVRGSNPQGLLHLAWLAPRCRRQPSARPSRCVLDEPSLRLRPVVVGQEGIEPPTRSLEGCCSVRLSYCPEKTPQKRLILSRRLLTGRAPLLGHVPRHPEHDPEHAPAEPAAHEAAAGWDARRAMFLTGDMSDLVLQRDTRSPARSQVGRQLFVDAISQLAARVRCELRTPLRRRPHPRKRSAGTRPNTAQGSHRDREPT